MKEDERPGIGDTLELDSFMPVNEELTPERGPFTTFFGGFVENEALGHVGKALYHAYEDSQFKDEVVPEGWKAYNKGLLEKYPDRYHSQILNAPTPKSQELLTSRIDDELFRQKYLEEGNSLAYFAGAATAGVLDFVALDKIISAWTPTFSMQSAVAASAGKGFIQNASKALPYAATYAAVLNAPKLASNVTYQTEDYAAQVAAETAFGTLLPGLAGSIDGKLLSNKITAVKDGLKGMDFEAVYDKTGFVRLKVNANGSTSLSAADVDKAQQFVDDAILPYIGQGWFEKIFETSPLIRGLGSKYGVVREYAKNLFNKGPITTSDELRGRPPIQTAEQIIEAIRGSHYQLMRAIDGEWEQYAGIGGVAKDTQSIIKNKFLNESFLDRRNFAEQVSMAVRNGGKHDIPEVSTAAGHVRKVYDELYDEAVKLKLLPAGLGTATADAYLNRVYNKNVLASSEAEFVQDVSQSMFVQSERIRQHQEKYKTPEALQEAIKRGEIEDILINRPIPLTDKEIKDLTKIHQERTKLVEDIKFKPVNAEALELEANRFLGEAKEIGFLASTVKSERNNIVQNIRQLKQERESAVKAIDNSVSEQEIADLNVSLERIDANIQDLTQELEFNKLLLKEEVEYATDKEAETELKNQLQSQKELKKELADLRSLQKEFKAKKISEKEGITSQQARIREDASKRIAEIEEALQYNKKIVSDLELQQKETLKTKGLYRESQERIRTLNREGREANKIAKQKLSEYDAETERKIDSGEISERIASLKTNGKGYNILDLEQRPKLHAPVKDLTDAQRIAKSVYDTLSHDHPEDLAMATLRGAGGYKSEGSSPFLARTLIVPDSVLEPYLVNNIYALTSTHINTMGKAIGREKAFRNMGYDSADDGIKQIYKDLKSDYESANQKLIDKPQTPEVKKEIAKNKKDYDKAKDFIDKSYKVLTGNTRGNMSPGWINFLKSLQQYTVMKALGGLPLLQITDAGMLLRQQGVYELFSSTLYPMIRGAFKDKEFLSNQDDLAHAGLAINSALSAYGRAWQEGSEPDLLRGWSNKSRYFLDAAASKFMNITGSNPIQDTLQHIAGVKAQARNVQLMDKFKKGTLTDKDWKILRSNGLDPRKHADGILAQYGRFGEAVNYKDATTYVSNYHLWDDFDAKNAMLSAIRREVDAIILTPNYLDVPFWFRDPLGQSISMFLSYSFAATNQRLIPFLQAPDVAQAQSELAILTLASFVQPIRDILDGREADLSPKSLAAGALTNWGFLGTPMEYFNRFNSIFDIPYLNAFRNNRYGQRGIGSLLGGAPGGVIESTVQSFNDLSTGKIRSQAALKGLAKSFLWGSSAWYARPFVNAAIESTGLPEKRKDAQEWFPGSKDWLNGLDEW